MRDWANDNEAIQALRGALTPVKDWIKVHTHTHIFTILPTKYIHVGNLSCMDEASQRPTSVRVPGLALFQYRLMVILSFLQEKADVVKDQSFSDMYESVKTSVKDMDDRLGTWLQEKTSK